MIDPTTLALRTIDKKLGYKFVKVPIRVDSFPENTVTYTENVDLLLYNELQKFDQLRSLIAVPYPHFDILNPVPNNACSAYSAIVTGQNGYRTAFMGKSGNTNGEGGVALWDTWQLIFPASEPSQISIQFRAFETGGSQFLTRIAVDLYFCNFEIDTHIPEIDNPSLGISCPFQP